MAGQVIKIPFWGLMLCMLFMMCCGSSYANQSEIDSLFKVLNTTNNENQDKVLNQIASSYILMSQDDAIKHAEMALAVAKRQEDIEQQSESFYIIGKAYYYLGNFSLSLSNYQRALVLARRAGLLTNMCDVLRGIGVCYYSKGEYSKAIDTYNRSLELANQLGDEKRIAKLYHGFASVFLAWKKEQEALNYFNKSLKIKEKLGDKEGISKTLNNIGAIYFTMGDYDNVLEYFNRSLLLKKELGDQKGFANTLLNIGVVYDTLGDYNKSLEYLEQALKKNKDLQTKQGEAIALNNIGAVYLKKGNFIEAESYFEKGLNVASEIDLKNTRLNSYKGFSELYEKTRKFNLSLFYYKKYIELKDSLFTYQSQQQLNELQVRYETESKEQKIELLNKEQELQQSQFEKQKIYNLVLIVCIVLVILFSLILIRQVIQKRKANRLLELKNSQVEVQANELEYKNKELEKLSLVASQTDNVVTITDSKGNIQWANDALFRMTGYTLDEYLDKKGTTLQDTSSNEEISKEIEKCIQNKSSAIYISESITKNGDKIWLQTTLTPIFNSEGELERLVAIDSDISKTKMTEEQLKQKNTDITDSLNYAQKIQDAMLPGIEYLDKLLEEYFIYYKPREIVSGDFYWAANRGEKVYIAAADCTGHGVPGAFMSILGLTFLDEAVTHYKHEVGSSGEILNVLRRNIVRSLHYKGRNSETQDGMDIALCIIDKKSGSIEYSGANNPLFIVSNEKYSEKYKFINHELQSETTSLFEIKPDKMPIGIYSTQVDKSFNTFAFQYASGDKIYMFSDGYPDQFGGEKGKKYLTKRFKKLIHETSSNTMIKQKELLENEHNSWKGSREQIDDIVIIGIKL
ncbi:MAG: hypothetical protein C0594_09595 [Marinilabiliales bacterium]|nr:MAG: hypothetical protein C0594_09595 [Marinilabiliales bacterium]